MKLVVAAAAACLALCGAGQAASGPRLDVPRLGLHTDIYSSITSGPAWWPYTDRPGGHTTVAIAAHRTWPTRYEGQGPFRYINRLRAGDSIYVTWGGKKYRYVVTHSRVRPVTDLFIARPTTYERLLLTSCSRADGSPTSDYYVYVVYARPVAT